MRSRLFLECPQTPIYFLLLLFFTVDRKSSRRKIFSQNTIYMFYLYHFSLKCIIKNFYLSCNDPHKPKNESLPLTVGMSSGQSSIALQWKDHISVIANSVGSTDNRDQVMNTLRTVPGHNHVINVHELRQIVKILRNDKAVGNEGIPSEVYRFASERLLTMMSIFLPRLYAYW